MLAVMGATGKTGGTVLAELRRRGVPARGLTRDAGRSAWQAGLIEADPFDPDSLVKAFDGCHGAYVLIPPLIHAADVLAMGKAIAEAIAEAVGRAGLRHVVALSSGGVHLAHGIGPIRSMLDLEHALRRTGASLTLIRAADFMENWAGVALVARTDGVLPSALLPLDRPMQTVSTLDIGRLAASCLLEPDRGERIINLLGPADYTPNEMGLAFARQLGRPVTVVPLPREALPGALAEAGIGQDYARGLIEIYDGLNAGRITFEPGMGETRRGSVTIDEAVRRMLTD
ncbi:MAG TPA: NmrA family NAD(P)-binding protein [Geminicoccus sp.]|jgi:uncharacterized protein YbjT (DUF2867 family)|uniref:NmrA family NAD(P)-binding protein n=1 Tax=Geminicoccus sp. TaxID=2024832 RepID=UPI002E364833|nr:NmrA family NAD(P)-binding protein [Geminicoccus sp.]HEX2526438.1 NmrA family NAD(P)-binding protein [Geminicoccus sp.]